MKSCDECVRLRQRLQRANEHYIRLIFEQDRMTRDGNARPEAFEDVIQEGQSSLISAAKDLLAHRGTHEGLSRPKTKTAGTKTAGQLY
jgi:hypothetical protein